MQYFPFPKRSPDSNLEVHQNCNNNAVITVGGQAVQYWISYYHAQYGDRLPDERLTASVDCDYSARKDDIAAIAKTLNVKTWENKDGQPPSLAQFMLIDQDTHDIKRDDGRLFAIFMPAKYFRY